MKNINNINRRKFIINYLASGTVLTIFPFSSLNMCAKLDSEGQTVNNHNLMPSFSWAKVPNMAHFGNDYGLTDDEISFLVKHFSLIVLEKTHGYKKYGSTEAGIMNDAIRIKAKNPDIKILSYWSASINCHRGRYESAKVFGAHPEWALKDKEGNIVYDRNGWEKYDHSNPHFREWWVSSVVNVVNTPFIDGVFIDGLPQFDFSLQQNIEEFGFAKQKALEEGVMKSIKEIREKTPKKTLMFNGLRWYKSMWENLAEHYFKYMDGVMIEHFTILSAKDMSLKNKNTIAKNIEIIQQVSKKKKFVVVKGFPNFTWQDSLMMKKPFNELAQLAYKQLIFPLATFLIAAGLNTYFCYSWGYKGEHGTFLWHPEFDKPLGKPKGDAIKDGWIYTRKFEHCDVWVDIENEIVNINWF